MANQYRRYVIREELHDESEAKLFVKEVRDGSTIVELFSYVHAHQVEVSTFITTSSAIVGFGAYLKKTYDEIRNGKKPVSLSIKDLSDLRQILEPTAKDPGGVVEIHADHGAVVQVSIKLQNSEANAIQNQAGRLIEEMQETDQLKFNKRAFYWDVASKGEPRSTDKGFIDSIESRPVHVVFDDTSIKDAMVAGKAHPFNTTYVVDVELLTSRGRTRAYKIIKLHEIIEEADDE